MPSCLNSGLGSAGSSSMRRPASMLHRFWQAIEEIPGLQAVLAEWRMHLGEGFESVRSLLIPTDRLAESIPIADDPYASYRVVRHAPNDIVGVHDGGGAA